MAQTPAQSQEPKKPTSFVVEAVVVSTSTRGDVANLIRRATVTNPARFIVPILSVAKKEPSQ